MPAGKIVRVTKTTPQKKAYVTKQQMYKAIHKNIENKMNYDRMVGNFGSVGSTWLEQTTSAVAQGTGNNQRIGNQIRIRSIEINGVIAQGSQEFATDDPWNTMRIVLALWAGGTVSTPLGTAAFDMNTPLRRTNCPQGLMKKYYDKYVPLTVVSTEKGGGDGYAPGLRKFKFFKIFKKGLLIDFGDATTTRPDKRLIISMISDSFVVTNPGFLQGFWAVSYEDA